MVASDRLSAFDVVLADPIPGKGKVLTEMALFWFGQLANIVPNHLTGEDPCTVVSEEDAPQVRGRAMLVRRLRPLPIEAVVRGYLVGSGWKEYTKTQSICGVPLPAGLKQAAKLPEPIFTPATKAAVGDHDENISFAETAALIGDDLANHVKSVAISLYTAAAAKALERGIIIADTKFEFGLDQTGKLVLMDEVLTPDSSRFWPKESYREGEAPPSLDKQAIRDWLESTQVDGKPWNKRAPAPALPIEIIDATAKTYAAARDALLGK